MVSAIAQISMKMERKPTPSILSSLDEDDDEDLHRNRFKDLTP